jgi:hypothetical protein
MESYCHNLTVLEGKKTHLAVRFQEVDDREQQSQALYVTKCVESLVSESETATSSTSALSPCSSNDSSLPATPALEKHLIFRTPQFTPNISAFSTPTVGISGYTTPLNESSVGSELDELVVSPSRSLLSKISTPIELQSIPISVPRVVILTITHGENLLKGRGGLFGFTTIDNSDPYVVVNSLTGNVKVIERCLSSSSTKIVYRTLTSTVKWDQEIVLAVVPDGKVVLSVIGSNGVAFHELLGQSVINFEKFPELFSTCAVVATSLPVAPQRNNIYNSLGNVIEIASYDPPQGEIFVEIRSVPIHTGCCGWFTIEALTFLGSLYYCKVWVVLWRNCLHIYDNPYGSDAVLRKMYKCSAILDIALIDGVVWKDASEGLYGGIKILLGESEDKADIVKLAWVSPGESASSKMERIIWVQALTRYNEGRPDVSAAGDISIASRDRTAERYRPDAPSPYSL